jgi:hypothetical protein
MNNTRSFRSILATAILFAAAFCFASFWFAPSVHAQAAPDQSTAVANAALDTAGVFAQPFIVSFAQSHPWLLSLLAVVATLRLVFKPIVSAVEAYVKSTPSTADDAVVANVEHSPIFKVFAWLLDYLGSIKVGPQFTATKPTTPAQG